MAQKKENKEVKTIDRTNIIVTKQRKTSRFLRRGKPNKKGPLTKPGWDRNGRDWTGSDRTGLD